MPIVLDHFHYKNDKAQQKYSHPDSEHTLHLRTTSLALFLLLPNVQALTHNITIPLPKLKRIQDNIPESTIVQGSKETVAEPFGGPADGGIRCSPRHSYLSPAPNDTGTTIRSTATKNVQIASRLTSGSPPD